MSRIQSEAAVASQRATPKLLELLDDPDFRRRFATVVPFLAGLSAAQLLERYRNEVAVTEITHNFPAAHELATFNSVDVDLRLLANASYFWNQWEIQYAYPEWTDKDTTMEWMVPAAATEMGLYKMKAFTGESPFDIHGLGGWPATYAEASERLVYTSFNQYRTDIGVDEFGPIAVLFDRSYIQNMTVLSAVDTGDFESLCNNTFTHLLCSQQKDDQNACAKFWYCGWDKANGQCDSMQRVLRKDVDYGLPGCDYYDGTPGTLAPGHFDHMLLANVFFWNRSCFTCGGNASNTVKSTPAENLAFLLGRLFAGWAQGSHGGAGIVGMRDNLHEHYTEANIMGAPHFPAAVSLVVGDFATLFGTALGEELQQWCAKWGWPLAWALGPNKDPSADPDSSYTNNISYPANKRFLDPTMLRVASPPSPPTNLEGGGVVQGNSSCGANLTGVNASASVILRRYWKQVNTSREHFRQTNHTHPFPPTKVVADWWGALAAALGDELRVEPLHAADCGSSGDGSVPASRCVGINWRRDCVCYQ
jgi:hypothetical protein